MESSPSKRNRISDKQKSILEIFHGARMVGPGLSYKDLIKKAVVDTGLTTAQVEVGYLILFYQFIRV